MLERARSLANNNQAALTVCAVVPRLTAGLGMPDGGPISAELQDAEAAAARQYLEDLVAPVRAQLAVATRVLMGTGFLEVIREVLRHGHDLVIKAPEDPSWLDRLLGSDDMHLLRKCPCPVWLVKQSSSIAYGRILAAVDVDADYPPDEFTTRYRLNVKILELAASLALADGADLHVAHAWIAVGENAMRGSFLRRPETEVVAYVAKVQQFHNDRLEALLDDVVQARGADFAEYLRPQKHLIKGQPRKEIARLARNLKADLVVMGTVGRTGVPGFFIGNTAEAILEQLDCSVLAVKPEGFQTPVDLEERAG